VERHEHLGEQHAAEGEQRQAVAHLFNGTLRDMTGTDDMLTAEAM
jgi:hypothetical protein